MFSERPGSDESDDTTATTAGYAAYALTAEGLVATWPASARQIKGYAPAEIIGKHISLFYLPADVAAKRPENLLRRAAKTGFAMDEGWRVRKDGTRFRAGVVITPTHDAQGRLVGFSKFTHDLSGIIQTETALRLSEEKFYRAFADAASSMALVSLTGAWLEVNQALCDYLGYSRADLLKLNFQTLTHPEDLAADLDLLNRTLRREINHYRIEKRYLRRDGTVVSGLLNVSLIRDKEGAPRYFLSQVIDTTEMKAAENVLRHERNLLQTLIDALPDRIYICDRDSRLLYDNKASRDGLQPTSSHVPRDILEPGTATGGRQRLQDLSVMESGVPLFDQETEISDPEGRFRWVLNTKIPLREADGTVSGMVGIARDVTELRSALQRSQALTDMLNQANDAIISSGLDGLITYWNIGAERIFGWKASEAIGRRTEDLLTADDMPAILAARDTTLAHGEWRGELSLHGKSGRAVIIDSHQILFRDSSGKPAGHLTIALDITAKKHAETELLRAQRMESIGTLASGIAHDLNNVLAPILMSIALFKLKIPDSPELHRQLDQLSTNTERGASLVRRLLTFGRGFSGDRILFQPKHIAREVIELIEDTFPKHIDFDFKFDPDLWNIVADPTQLHQILLNLCVNARDAMPSRGRLALNLHNLVLEENDPTKPADAPPGPYIVLTVSDTGMGIPAAISEKIFDPFFTTKEPGQGTGLGLSTTLAIVRSHEGFLEFESSKEKGTTFRIYLPASKDDAPVAVLSKTAQLEGRGELILMVDDDAVIREVTQRTLERFGYRVLLAHNGVEAVTKYAVHHDKIAAVITDMAMPIMGGPATILALRGINPKVKIIALSGHGTDSARKEVALAGTSVSDFVAKPYSTELLLQKLRTVIGEGTRPPFLTTPPMEIRAAPSRPPFSR